MINLLSQSTYSKILLIRYAQDRTGAGLSNITDYKTVPILTQVLAGNLFVTALILGLFQASYLFQVSTESCLSCQQCLVN